MIEIKRGEYKYDAKDILGKGSFGEVYKCFNKEGQKLALKVISGEKLSTLGTYGQELLKRELKTHKEATNSGIPFFVNLIDSFYRNKDLILILEFCDSDLAKVLKKPIPENIILRLVMQIGIGLLYLHSMGFIHRDIKPDNIFVKDGIIKIGDFGFATDDVSPGTELGTLPYKAPELFGREPYDNKVDVWSLNTLFYKFLTKKFYFSTQNNAIYVKEITTRKFEVDKKFKISPVIEDILQKGYIKNRFERPNILEYLNHPAFDEIRKDYEVFFTKLPKKLSTISSSETINSLTSYVKNVMSYYNLSQALKSNQENNVIAFFLLKKGLQKLSVLYLFAFNKTTPNFFNIPQNEWSELCEKESFKETMKEWNSKIKTMAKDYIVSFNDIKTTYTGEKNSTFLENLNTMKDLNYEIDNDCFFYYFNESMNKEKKKSSELCPIFDEINEFEQNPKSIFK